MAQCKICNWTVGENDWWFFFCTDFTRLGAEGNENHISFAIFLLSLNHLWASVDFMKWANPEPIKLQQIDYEIIEDDEPSSPNLFA